MFPLWYDTVPKWEGELIHSWKLQCFISNGTYVLLKHGAIGRVVYSARTDPSSTTKYLICNVYEMATDAVLSKAQLQKCADFGVREVLKTHKRVHLMVDEVVDFAFLFCWHEVENGFVHIVGMKDASVCDKRQDLQLMPFPTYHPEARVEQIDEDEQVAFPSLHQLHQFFDCCVSQEIFNGIMNAQHAMHRILGHFASEEGGRQSNSFCNLQSC